MTLEMLKATPEDKLLFSPGKGLGSLSKQFRHLANVQHCYIEAIKTGKIDFSKKIYMKDYDKKDTLIEILEKEDETMIKLVEGLKEKDFDKIIYWGGEHNPTVVEHLFWLIDHEVMHHGQLIVYWQLLERKFPESWKVWGL